MEFLLINPKFINGTHFGIISAILDSSIMLYLRFLKSYIAEILNLSSIPLNVLLGPILTLNWICLVRHLLLLKRGRKAPRRAQRDPHPSAGARRRCKEHPKLLVYYDKVILYKQNYECFLWQFLSHLVIYE